MSQVGDVLENSEDRQAQDSFGEDGNSEYCAAFGALQSDDMRDSGRRGIETKQMREVNGETTMVELVGSIACGAPAFA